MKIVAWFFVCVVFVVWSAGYVPEATRWLTRKAAELRNWLKERR